MLELFFKHLDFVAPELTERGYQDHEKYIYKFDFEMVNKHWLSFCATYMRGRKSAFDDLGVWAVQNVSKFSV